MGKRFERKFIFRRLCSRNVEVYIKLNIAGFNEIFHQRFINNIYFDTLGFENYYDNIDGIANRVKYRIRWYDDFFSGSKNAVFEIKRRFGSLVEKQSLPLKNFNLNPKIDINNYFKRKSKKWGVNIINNNNLIPVLINRYHRKYFLSRDKNFRVTIDSNIEASPIHQHTKFNFIPIYESSVILELKYDEKCSSNVESITNSFKTRLNKNSKYVEAFEFLKI